MRGETVGGMRTPSINLARRPFRNNTVHYAVFVACAVLLLAATIVNVREYFLRGTELTVLRDQISIGHQRYDKLFKDVETMKREIAQVNLDLLNDKSAFVNGLILSRLFSWSLLFDRLEELLPYDVKVRSIRPSISAKEIEIQIDGMAKSYLDLYEFEAKLGNSEYFVGVYPTNEDNRQSKNELNFDLIMKYLPAGKSGKDASPPTPTAGLPQNETQPQEEGAAVAQEAETEPGGEGVVAVLAGSEESGEKAAEVVDAPSEHRPPVQGPPKGAGGAGPQPEAGGAPVPVDGTHAPATQEPAPAGAGAVAGNEAPSQKIEPGPMMKMSNKEFFEKRGEERFVRVRGNMVPQKADDQPDMTNAEYIKRFGVEQFLARRGSLAMAQQRVKAPVSP